MTKAKQVISGAALLAVVFGLSTPALADWRDRNHAREYRQDVRDLQKRIEDLVAEIAVLKAASPSPSSPKARRRKPTR